MPSTDLDFFMNSLYKKYQMHELLKQKGALDLPMFIVWREILSLVFKSANYTKVGDRSYKKEFNKKIASVIDKISDSKKPINIIDVGSYDGTRLNNILSLTNTKNIEDIVCIDINETALEKAKTILPINKYNFLFYNKDISNGFNVNHLLKNDNAINIYLYLDSISSNLWNFLFPLNKNGVVNKISSVMNEGDYSIQEFHHNLNSSNWDGVSSYYETFCKNLGLYDIFGGHLEVKQDNMFRLTALVDIKNQVNYFHEPSNVEFKFEFKPMPLHLSKEVIEPQIIIGNSSAANYSFKNYFWGCIFGKSRPVHFERFNNENLVVTKKNSNSLFTYFSEIDEDKFLKARYIFERNYFHNAQLSDSEKMQNFKVLKFLCKFGEAYDKTLDDYFLLDYMSEVFQENFENFYESFKMI